MSTVTVETEDVRPPLDLPDVLQFMQLLWAVVHGLERTSKRMTGEIGVTGPQRLALRLVGLFPGLSAGDLAAILHVRPSTLKGVLQRLVAQRLVARMDDPRDRRRAVLRLTRRGARANAVSYVWRKARDLERREWPWTAPGTSKAKIAREGRNRPRTSKTRTYRPKSMAPITQRPSTSSCLDLMV